MLPPGSDPFIQPAVDEELIAAGRACAVPMGSKGRLKSPIVLSYVRFSLGERSVRHFRTARVGECLKQLLTGKHSSFKAQTVPGCYSHKKRVIKPQPSPFQAPMEALAQSLLQTGKCARASPLGTSLSNIYKALKALSAASISAPRQNSWLSKHLFCLLQGLGTVLVLRGKRLGCHWWQIPTQLGYILLTCSHAEADGADVMVTVRGHGLKHVQRAGKGK